MTTAAARDLSGLGLDPTVRPQADSWLALVRALRRRLRRAQPR